MLWDPQAETMPRAELEALQLQRLRWTVARALERVAPMRVRLHAAGSGPFAGNHGRIKQRHILTPVLVSQGAS